MRLVYDDKIPVDLSQTGEDVLAFGEVERGDDLLLLEPLVDAELVADVAALDDEKLLVEALLELPLPLNLFPAVGSWQNRRIRADAMA